jgi:hypothetical protein
MAQSNYFVAFILFMSRKKLFNEFKARIARCQSPAELLQISHDINSADLRPDQKGALALGCMYAAKYFDKHGVKFDAENSALECSREV